MSVFVGFGFGAIQGGLFVPEVYQSGNFDRIVISEVNQDLVRQVNDAGGQYSFNIAEKDRVKTLQVEGLEILNPSVPEDRKKLVHAIGEAQELCTALPSFKLYDHGESSVVRLITDGLGLKKNQKIFLQLLYMRLKMMRLRLKGSSMPVRIIFLIYPMSGLYFLKQ